MLASGERDSEAASGLAAVSAGKKRFGLQHGCVRLAVCNSRRSNNGVREKKSLICLWCSSGFTDTKDLVAGAIVPG